MQMFPPNAYNIGSVGNMFLAFFQVIIMLATENSYVF